MRTYVKNRWGPAQCLNVLLQPSFSLETFPSSHAYSGSFSISASYEVLVFFCKAFKLSRHIFDNTTTPTDEPTQERELLTFMNWTAINVT